MATTPAPNSRASLLAGLRTGGVRSVSGPIPHTASPAGSFNIHQYAQPVSNDALYTTEEEDELADMVSQNLYIKNNFNRMQQPMTAAVDGGVNRFSYQQNVGVPGAVPMNPYASAAAAQSQMQAMQMQLVQLEIARLQAQQYQAELLAQAQAQLQRSAHQPQRRSTMPFMAPVTAGPTNTTFDMRSAAMGVHGRRPNQADQLRAMLGLGMDEQVPMTAALGGRFGSRVVPGQYGAEDDYLTNSPAAPNYTTAHSGGYASGGSPLGNGNGNTHPSKSDAAVSWRRGGNNSVLSGNRSVSSPVVKITPPPTECTSPSTSPVKTRPPALRFTAAVSQLIDAVAVDHEDGDDSSSVSSSKSGSTPSTPRTASSLNEAPPLSPREEAAKKLYEGLGIGRPVPAIAVTAAPPPIQRLVANPVRQPRGPPSNHEDLLPKNFVTRSRRKAIGALGALLDAREKREGVESA